MSVWSNVGGKPAARAGRTEEAQNRCAACSRPVLRAAASGARLRHASGPEATLRAAVSLRCCGNGGISFTRDERLPRLPPSPAQVLCVWCASDHTSTHAKTGTRTCPRSDGRVFFAVAYTRRDQDRIHGLTRGHVRVMHVCACTRRALDHRERYRVHLPMPMAKTMMGCAFPADAL